MTGTRVICGTIDGYYRHLQCREVPCHACSGTRSTIRAEWEAALPLPTWPGAAAMHRKHLDRIENYLDVGGDHMPEREAARRLGVSMRTVVRWRKVLRQVAYRRAGL
jgi:hypothetical protein